MKPQTLANGKTMQQSTSSPNNKADGSASKLTNLLTSKWLHLSVLIAVVFALFGRTLSSYFLADDFGEVHYVSQIFNGRLDLLWSNFTGNFMQIPSMSVYRPWLLISLVIDYFFWQANATGYYLTNLVHFGGVVSLFYLVTRFLTREWSKTSSSLCAFSTALIFAASPLHCESISWVVGRVDIISCFYYLLSFYLLMQAQVSKNKLPLTIIGIASFWLGLCTKEMAIGLPVLATAAGFLWPKELTASKLETSSNRSEASSSPRQESSSMANTPRLSERIACAVSMSLPLWLSTVIYFVIRYFALGTLGGGYTGGLGAGQISGILSRWTDIDTLKRLAFPFAIDLYPHPDALVTLLSLAYLFVGFTALARLVCRDICLKWFIFIGVWAATAMAPIYQLWGLGYNLEGARFYFFLSLPLSLLAPIVLFSPASKYSLLGPSSKIRLRFALLGAATLSLIFAIDARAAYATNLLWVHAGKQVKSFLRQAQELANDSNSKYIILGIPKDKSGAHMILNGDTFRLALSPPFTNKNYSKSFITFDPVLFGPDQFINSARFQTSLLNPSTKGVLLWNGQESKFTPITLNTAALNTTKVNTGALNLMAQPITCLPHDSSLRFANFNLNPLAYDYLELELNKPSQVSVSWGESSNNQAIQTKPATRMLISLSGYWRWYTAGQIKHLDLQFPGSSDVLVKQAKLIRANSIKPVCTVANSSEPSSAGIYDLHSGGLELQLDNGTISGATATSIEISRPNYFFEADPSAPQEKSVAEHLSFKGNKALLPANLFPEVALYQVRSIAIDASGKPIGEYSDSITVSRSR
jgi:hypothetical protein